jgi:hypothetical protein
VSRRASVPENRACLKIQNHAGCISPPAMHAPTPMRHGVPLLVSAQGRELMHAVMRARCVPSVLLLIFFPLRAFSVIFGRRVGIARGSQRERR